MDVGFTPRPGGQDFDFRFEGTPEPVVVAPSLQRDFGMPLAFSHIPFGKQPLLPQRTAAIRVLGRRRPAMSKSPKTSEWAVRMRRAGRAVACTSTIRGVEERETGQPRVYYGIVTRTPQQVVKSGFMHPDTEWVLDAQHAAGR